MENQHRKITGYRELSQEEINLMNAIKQQGVTLDALVTMIAGVENVDGSWLTIGCTDIQTGLMAQPTTF
jgi:hypothetical protein